MTILRKESNFSKVDTGENTMQVVSLFTKSQTRFSWVFFSNSNISSIESTQKLSQINQVQDANYTYDLQRCYSTEICWKRQLFTNMT